MSEEVNPIDSMDTEIDQLSLFHEDLSVLQRYTGDKYLEDFKELRDKTNQLRSEYAALYSKILTDDPKLKVYVGAV
ncbi:MAG: hypothetical protein IJF83_07545 [Methanobrevibacter sp.]|nr:hypothetical protein [Methanobrevibacter sp.]